MMLMIMIQVVNHLNIRQKQHKELHDQHNKPPANSNGSQPPQPDEPAIPPSSKEVTIPLKYLSNFWKSLVLPLINCEVELDLKWPKNCVLIEDGSYIIDKNFVITSAKLYFPVVTLSINYNIKFFENIKQ